MNSLYGAPKPKSNATSTTNPNKQQSGEAIDISSDESGNESNQSKSNGKSLPKGMFIDLKSSINLTFLLFYSYGKSTDCQECCNYSD